MLEPLAPESFFLKVILPSQLHKKPSLFLYLISSCCMDSQSYWWHGNKITETWNTEAQWPTFCFLGGYVRLLGTKNFFSFLLNIAAIKTVCASFLHPSILENPWQMGAKLSHSTDKWCSRTFGPRPNFQIQFCSCGSNRTINPNTAL